MQYSQIKLEISVPAEFLEAVADAIHQAGGGRIGLYDHCMSYWPIDGRWRPLQGASPFDGTVGQIQHGSELRVECLCDVDVAGAVVAAVRAVHPYEEAVIVALPVVAL
jgi:hypothetical protein